METSDFFRSRIDTMINLGDPLAVLATRLPWVQIEAALAPMFAHRDRAGGPLPTLTCSARAWRCPARGAATLGDRSCRFG